MIGSSFTYFVLGILQRLSSFLYFYKNWNYYREKLNFTLLFIYIYIDLCVCVMFDV